MRASRCGKGGVCMDTSFWSVEQNALLEALHTGEGGLSAQQAEERLQRDGLNTLRAGHGDSRVRMLLSQFLSPLTLVLIFAAMVSLFTGDLADGAIILLIVVASGLLSYFQENNAGNAVKRLMDVVSVKATVLRDGQAAEVPVEALAVGDVIRLSGGDLIPADCRLLSADGLTADESTLTGETLPVDKAPGVLPADTPLAARSCALWMGTHVISGSGVAVVARTARQSELGKIVGRLNAKPQPNEFERGVNRFGMLLVRITVTMAFAIFAINVFLRRPAMDSLMFSLALAVGLTPQLLPAIININLAHGAREMARSRVIVKKLSTIENFGSMNVLCSDKTGTITSGVVTLQGTLDPQGQPSDLVALAARLNATLQSGYDNPIDRAIRAQGQDSLAGYDKVGEIPYNFADKRLSVIVRTPQDSPFGGKPVLIAKGALENILSACDTCLLAGQKVPIGPTLAAIRQQFADLSGQGLRTLGLAMRDAQADTPALTRDQGLCFLGFLTLLDPLKEGIADTVQHMKEEGVALKVITGDNRLIAAHIARQLDLDDRNILTGGDLIRMSDSALERRAQECALFAEIEPNQKERIILALKRGGSIVGYMGDGINDASAIRSADAGISVNNAADVAKDAAGIVLLENSLQVLLQGIRVGRSTFANTMKYVFMATSANFGNMFSMAGASILLPFLPLLPKQVLVMNLLTDMPEMQIASDRVDESQLTLPKRWNIAFIRKFMIVFGCLSSVFDYLTFGALMLFGNMHEALFQTAWFTESILSASIIVLVIRTRQPFFKSRPARGLTIATLLVGLVTLALPDTPVAGLLGFVPLPPVLYAVIAGILVVYVASAELTKHWFFGRVKEG